MPSRRCCPHPLSRYLVTILCVPTLVVFLQAGCGEECPGSFLGSSATNHVLTTDWPYGDGGAAGSWDLNLVPNTYGTNCVTIADNQFPTEAYSYTLEFPDASADQLTNIYVNGVLFATGEYTDEEGDAPDTLDYITGERLDETRTEGAITYYIEGQASLEANRRAGTLTWTGFEQIVVIESEDPEINAGCVFYYDVTGAKVCDE